MKKELTTGANREDPGNRKPLGKGRFETMMQDCISPGNSADDSGVISNIRIDSTK